MDGLVIPSVISVVVAYCTSFCVDFEFVFVVACVEFNFVNCYAVIVVFVSLCEGCCGVTDSCVVESDALSLGKGYCAGRSCASCSCFNCNVFVVTVNFSV